jgi:ribose transport system permease protein
VLLLYGVYIVYAILFGVIIGLSPGFLKPVNLLHLLTQSSVTIIVCAGNAFVLLTAGIDMSVGSVAFFGPALCAFLLTNAGISPILAILLIIVVGTLLGALNGFIVKQFNVYPLITTLGVLFACRGLGQYLIQGGVWVFPDAIQFFGNGSVLGIPVPILIAAVFLVVGQFVLVKTSFGRLVVAIGDNEQAAEKSGIKVGRIKFLVYTISGFSAGIAGLVLTGQVSKVYPNTGKDLDFDVLIALVLGGVSLFGAKGSVFPGAFIGAIFLTTIFNGLIASNASPYLFSVIKGIVIFAAILVDTIKVRRNVISIYRTTEASGP